MKKTWLLALLSLLVLSGCTIIKVIQPPPFVRPLGPVMFPPRAENTMTINNSLLIDPRSPAVTYGQVTLLGLNLNNQGNHVTVHRGDTVAATVAYLYNCPTCQTYSINQIIIGLANEGAQACIFNGNTQSQGIAYFNLHAPKKPGTYEIRFRYAQAYNCNDAITKWWKVDKAPEKIATVGMITVI